MDANRRRKLEQGQQENARVRSLSTNLGTVRLMIGIRSESPILMSQNVKSAVPSGQTFQTGPHYLVVALPLLRPAGCKRTCSSLASQAAARVRNCG